MNYIDNVQFSWINFNDFFLSTLQTLILNNDESLHKTWLEQNNAFDIHAQYKESIGSTTHAPAGDNSSPVNILHFNPEKGILSP